MTCALVNGLTSVNRETLQIGQEYYRLETFYCISHNWLIVNTHINATSVIHIRNITRKLIQCDDYNLFVLKVHLMSCIRTVN